MKKFIAFYRRKRFGKVAVLTVAGYDTKKDLSADMKAIGLKVVNILSDEEIDFDFDDKAITIETHDYNEVREEIEDGEYEVLIDLSDTYTSVVERCIPLLDELDEDEAWEVIKNVF